MDIGRTIMANERTLPAFLRTSLGFFLSGIALIKYLKHPLIQILGWVSIFLAPVFLVWGLYRYRHVKKVLKGVTPKELVTVEKEIGL
jgi:putative membrane protein